jgi:hypothetical protein
MLRSKAGACARSTYSLRTPILASRFTLSVSTLSVGVSEHHDVRPGGGSREPAEVHHDRQTDNDGPR